MILQKQFDNYGNCSLEHDQQLMTKLVDLGILMRQLAKLDLLERVADVRGEIDTIIDEKCNGMQNFNSTTQYF